MIKLIHYSEGDGPLYFYGGFFSNFAQLRVHERPHYHGSDPTREGAVLYDTAEHFFQASKATNREDHDKIANAPDPGTAKSLGQRIDLRPDWEGERPVDYLIMIVGLRSKFGYKGWPQDKLLKTGSRWIAEDSPHDFKWGIRDEDGGMTGQNLLGLALMQVRDEIVTGRMDSLSVKRTIELASEHQTVDNDTKLRMSLSAA